MTVTTLLPDPATPLSHQSAAEAFAAILDGTVADATIAAFLIALGERGETSIEIAEAARALRARMIPSRTSSACAYGSVVEWMMPWVNRCALTRPP